MGRGEHPALMMDSANCSTTLVSHTYLLPNNLPSAPNYSYFHSWWQLYVSVSETKTEEVGVGGTAHLQPGWYAGSGCLPALCHPAGMQELAIDNRLCLCSSFEVPQGPKCSGSTPQACALADPGTDVPPGRFVVLSGTSPPLWWPSLSLSAGAGRKRVTMLRTL